jgi:hypothetical protein
MSHACNMLRLCHPTFDYRNHILESVTMKFIILLCSPTSCYLQPLFLLFYKTFNDYLINYRDDILTH